MRLIIPDDCRWSDRIGRCVVRRVCGRRQHKRTYNLTRCHLKTSQRFVFKSIFLFAQNKFFDESFYWQTWICILNFVSIAHFQRQKQKHSLHSRVLGKPILASKSKTEYTVLHVIVGLPYIVERTQTNSKYDSHSFKCRWTWWTYGLFGLGELTDYLDLRLTSL